MEAMSENGGDLAALAVFLVAWVAYEPILRALSRGRHVINGDMVTIRRRWMGEMVNPGRARLLDSQLIGHVVGSASFFASSNLILIAAAAGVLFGGERALSVIEEAPLLAKAPPILFSLKLGLVAIALARGFLSFIWAIRQLNYCVAVVGATPSDASAETLAAYADAANGVLTPALSAFNAGVRGYYFALSAAAWLFGPAAFAGVTIGATLLLGWRQYASPAAKGVRKVHDVLEAHIASQSPSEPR